LIADNTDKKKTNNTYQINQDKPIHIKVNNVIQSIQELNINTNQQKGERVGERGANLKKDVKTLAARG
jgi:hypothetical protein